MATVEQQKALAMAQARRRRVGAEGASVEQPATVATLNAMQTGTPVAETPEEPLIALPEGMTREDIFAARKAGIEETPILKRANEFIQRGIESGRFSSPEEDPLGANRPMPVIPRMVALMSGKGAETEETKNLPRISSLNQKGTPDFTLNLPLIGEQPFTFPRGGDLQRAAAFMVASSPEERVAMIKEAVPEMTFRYDQKGNIIGTFPDGREGVLNPPGFDFTDALSLSTEVAKFAPAGRATALGSTALQRLGLGIGTAALTQTGVEGVSAAMGGEFEPEQIAFESAAAAFGSIPDLWRAGKTNIIKPLARRRAAKEEAKALQELSSDPERALQLHQNVEEFDEAAKALGGEGVATVAQRTGAQDLLRQQTFLSMLPQTRAMSFKVLDSQDKKISEVMQNFVENFAPVEVLESGAVKFKMAANEVIETELNKLRQQAAPLYRQAAKMNSNVDLAEPRRLVQEFLKDQPQEGAVGPVAQELRKAFELMRGTQVAQGVRKKPTFSQLDNAKKIMDDAIQNQTPGESLSNQASAALSRVRNSLRDQLDIATRTNPEDAASSVYKQARSIYAEDLPEIISLREGVLGGIARMKDAQFKNISSRLFDAAEQNPRILKRVRRLVDEASPGAMDDMLSLELRKRLNQVRQVGDENVSNIAGEFHRKLFEPRGRFMALMNGASDEGRKNVMFLERYLKALSKGRPGGSQTAEFQEFTKQMQGGLLSKLGAIVGTGRKIATLGLADSGVGRKVGQALDERAKTKNMQALGNILFNTNWEPQFKKLRTLDLDNQGNLAKISRMLGQLVDEAAQGIDEAAQPEIQPAEQQAEQ